ncbi:MAG TPA: hypothetical protein VFF72_08355 [Caldimonas sp.]|nr:hypothetical protein [Caldimonas sp.]
MKIAEAAAARGLHVDALRRLARRHRNAFVVQRGTGGRGKSTMVDLSLLDAVLGIQGRDDTGSQRALRAEAALKRLPGIIRARFAEALRDGSLTGAPYFCKPSAAEWIVQYLSTEAELAIQYEGTTAPPDA